MRLIIFTLLILISNLIYSQELKLDNNLTGIYSQSTSTQFRMNFIGANQFSWKKHTIDWGVNYANKFSPKLLENEFINRLNYSHKISNNFEYFTTYQFNYSLIRSIESEHWTGVGISLKKKADKYNVSVSYATLIDNIEYSNDLADRNILRHSIRLKCGFETKIFNFKTEYFFQPKFNQLSDYIIYGTGSISLFPKNKVNLIIQDVLNFQTRSDVKLIHNVSIGIGWKLTKDFKS